MLPDNSYFSIHGKWLEGQGVWKILKGLSSNTFETQKIIAGEKCRSYITYTYHSLYSYTLGAEAFEVSNQLDQKYIDLRHHKETLTFIDLDRG